MTVTANRIPLEVDVWSEIESELATGFLYVTEVSFHYAVDLVESTLSVTQLEKGKSVQKRIRLNKDASERLIKRLAKRFNFQWENIFDFSVELRPNEIPIFKKSFYPFVDDTATLDTFKSRMNPTTID